MPGMQELPVAACGMFSVASGLLLAARGVCSLDKPVPPALEVQVTGPPEKPPPFYFF